MIILGQTSDEKGTQLEVLTREVLQHLGYKNLDVNVIGPGGQEADVTGEYEVPGVTATRPIKLLCECKAYKHPVSIDHWLTFLGKIYVEEKHIGSNVRGCFIALSGVNGNVSGSYEDLAQRPNLNVELVKGERLDQLLQQLYEVKDLRQVLQLLARLTSRQFQQANLIYYMRRVYWLFTFEREEYTVLNGKGELLTTVEVDTLRPMIESAEALNEYIDLDKEAAALQRDMLVRKSILGELMIQKGTFTYSTWAQKYGDYTNSEYESACKSIIESGWATESDDNEKALTLVTTPTELANVFRYLFDGEIPDALLNEVLGCEFYDQSINEQLLTWIQELQGGIPLSIEDIKEALQLLQLSPNALMSFTQPDPILARSPLAEIDEGNLEREKRFKHDYFFRIMYRCLAVDFQLPDLSRYFFQTRSVREFELNTDMTLKGQHAPLLHGSLRERLILGALKQQPDTYIHAIGYDDIIQPWDHPALQKQDEENEIQASAE